MNMNLYNRELQNGYVLQQIEKYKASANLAPVIIKVINQFDGKMFNVKLEKALREAVPDKYIHARKEYKNIIIGFYDGADHFTLASMPIDKLTDGKRIPADLLTEDARKRQEGFLKKAYEMQTAFNNMDTIFKQLEQLKSTIKAIINPIPYELLDVYRLDNYRRL